MAERKLIAVLPDGSRVWVSSPDAPCVADGGQASAVAALLNHVAELSPVDAARCFEQGVSSAGLAVRRLPGEVCEIAVDAGRVTLPAAALASAIDARLAERLAGESFWLFRPTPIAFRPSPGDRDFVTSLEHRARAFEDALTAGALDEVTESVRRRFLLVEFDESGLLDETLLDHKLHWLRTWELPALAAVAGAARDLWAYLHSEARRVHVDEPPPSRLADARISLDWMRAPAPVPPGWNAHEWLAVCERMFRKPQMPVSAGRGRMFLAQGSVVAELLWRRDDGEHPVLYGARVRERDQSPSR